MRFVVQKHDATRLHYDFRLELGGVFKSWAVTRGPSLDPHDKRLAVEVEDHPLDYGDFEGTIPKGQYGGGTVLLWDRGFWQPEGDAGKMLKKGDLKFTLEGGKLQGSWVLVRMRSDKFAPKNGKTDGKGGRNNWLLIKHQDKFAHEGDGDALLKKDHSIASGREMEDIAAGKGAKPSPSCGPRGSSPTRYGIPAQGWRGGEERPGRAEGAGSRARQDGFGDGAFRHAAIVRIRRTPTVRPGLGA